MNKLSHVLLAAAVLALALTIPLAQHGANRAPANDGLNSTLYVQSAAEYRAACMQAYALARLNLERAHLDSDWTAAIEQGDDYQAKKPAVTGSSDSAGSSCTTWSSISQNSKPDGPTVLK